MAFVFLFFTVEQCAKMSSKEKRCKVTPTSKTKKEDNNNNNNIYLTAVGLSPDGSGF
jgi:hypothetical protein